MKFFVTGIALAALTVVPLAAQVPTEGSASVKTNKSGASPTSLGFQQQSGRFTAVNEPLWRLIAEAYRASYQLRRFEIVDIPNGIDSERFDVEAVPAGNPAPSERQLMQSQWHEDRGSI